jgi:hypothetical protein
MKLRLLTREITLDYLNGPNVNIYEPLKVEEESKRRGDAMEKRNRAGLRQRGHQRRKCEASPVVAAFDDWRRDP